MCLAESGDTALKSKRERTAGINDLSLELLLGKLCAFEANGENLALTILLQQSGSFKYFSI